MDGTSIINARCKAYRPFLCHKIARGHLVFALSVIPSFGHSVASKFVFSTPPTSLHGFEWNLVQMLYLKSRSACGEIFHVWQILAELLPLTLRIITHFSSSSQLLLHPCMDLNETWQECCTTGLEVLVGEIIHVRLILAELWPLTFRIFTDFILSSQLLPHHHGFVWNLARMLHQKSRSACGEIIYVWIIMAELWSLTPRILHILACLLNSSYIVAWISMKLGRDVAS